MATLRAAITPAIQDATLFLLRRIIQEITITAKLINSIGIGILTILSIRLIILPHMSHIASPKQHAQCSLL